MAWRSPGRGGRGCCDPSDPSADSGPEGLTPLVPPPGKAPGAALGATPAPLTLVSAWPYVATGLNTQPPRPVSQLHSEHFDLDGHCFLTLLSISLSWEGARSTPLGSGRLCSHALGRRGPGVSTRCSPARMAARCRRSWLRLEPGTQWLGRWRALGLGCLCSDLVFLLADCESSTNTFDLCAR